jgi:hypothetical protein
MKTFLILVAFLAFSFPLSAQLSDNNNKEFASSEMASEKVVPAHRDFISVNEAS